MFYKNYLLHIISLYFAFSSVRTNVIVNTATGPVKGKLNYYEKTIYLSYEGIPYAVPPVGDLRFRPPVPVKPWKKVLDAFGPGHVCPQTENMYRRSEMNEDCLYLNVYVPITAFIERLPTIFYIHGGYFIVNSGRPEPIYGPQLFLGKDCIVVTTNYRLGALGFLSFEDVDASGNAGLKDIILASKWVKSNIANFGGNPDRICVLGTGVGAALAHYTLLTEQTSGIFSSAILISGSALSYRALQNNPKDNTLQLARELGITYTDRRVIQKLKQIDPFDIVEAEINIIRNDPRRAFILVNFFAPVVEKPSSIALITRNPLDIVLAEGLVQKIPVQIGFNNNEGLEIFSAIRADPSTVDTLNENFELCIPPNIQYPLGSQESIKLAESIQDVYFDGNNISIFNTQSYINLITDTAYAYGIDSWIKIYKSQKRSSAVYYYVFQFSGQLNWSKLVNGITYPGATRGDELGYFFVTNATKNLLQNLDYSSKRTLENAIITLSEFAASGSPSAVIDHLRWNEAGKNRNHIIIEDKYINVCEPPLQKRLAFWYKQYAKYYEYEQRKMGRIRN